MLKTERLIIAPWSAADAQNFYELSHDEGFGRFPINDYRQADPAAALQWIQLNSQLLAHQGLGKWAVRQQENLALIGMGGLTPWLWHGEELVDITYRLRSSAWGMGFGSELALALLSYAQKRSVNNLTATITPDNLASKKIILRLGFHFDQLITLKGVQLSCFASLSDESKYRTADRYALA